LFEKFVCSLITYIFYSFLSRHCFGDAAINLLWVACALIVCTTIYELCCAKGNWIELKPLYSPWLLLPPLARIAFPLPWVKALCGWSPTPLQAALSRNAAHSPGSFLSQLNQAFLECDVQEPCSCKLAEAYIWLPEETFPHCSGIRCSSHSWIG
jgi:hypothetical protein